MLYTKFTLRSFAALLCVYCLGMWATPALGTENNPTNQKLVQKIEKKLATERGQKLVERVLNQRAQRSEHFRILFRNLDILQRKKWDIRERIFDEQQSGEQVLETKMGVSVNIPADAVVEMTNLETGELLVPDHEGFTLEFHATIEEPQSRGYVMSCLSYVEAQQRNPYFRLIVSAEDMKRFSVVHTPKQMLNQHIRNLVKTEYKIARQELIATFRKGVSIIKRTLNKTQRKPAIALLRAKLKRDIRRTHKRLKRSIRKSVNSRELLSQFAEAPKLRKTIRFDVVESVVRCQMGAVR